MKIRMLYCFSIFLRHNWCNIKEAKSYCLYPIIKCHVYTGAWEICCFTLVCCTEAIVSFNGLVPSRKQTITWTNGSPVH